MQFTKNTQYEELINFSLFFFILYIMSSDNKYQNVTLRKKYKKKTLSQESKKEEFKFKPKTKLKDIFEDVQEKGINQVN